MAEVTEISTDTPKLWKNLEQGKDVILEIDIQGAMKVKEVFPREYLSFFCRLLKRN